MTLDLAFLLATLGCVAVLCLAVALIRRQSRLTRARRQGDRLRRPQEKERSLYPEDRRRSRWMEGEVIPESGGPPPPPPAPTDSARPARPPGNPALAAWNDRRLHAPNEYHAQLVVTIDEDGREVRRGAWALGPAHRQAEHRQLLRQATAGGLHIGAEPASPEPDDL